MQFILIPLFFVISIFLFLVIFLVTKSNSKIVELQEFIEYSESLGVVGARIDVKFVGLKEDLVYLKVRDTVSMSGQYMTVSVYLKDLPPQIQHKIKHETPPWTPEKEIVESD